MIGYLEGSIIDKSEKGLTVLTGGVGYSLFTPADLAASARLEQPIRLFVHTAVRENDISLYGFADKDQRRFFEQLIGISGVGPKTALEILSAPLGLVQKAIVEGDIAVLSKIKGLGKKTAEKISLELRDKVSPKSLHSSENQPKGKVDEEAVLALESLGYERYQILKGMADLPNEVQGTETIVRHFLKTVS